MLKAKEAGFYARTPADYSPVKSIVVRNSSGAALILYDLARTPHLYKDKLNSLKSYLVKISVKKTRNQV